MLSEERQFPHFLYEVTLGYYKAALSDPDVLVLTIGGLCLGSSSRRLRGMGGALSLYTTFRRLDRYVDAAVQIAQLAARNKQHTTTLWSPDA